MDAERSRSERDASRIGRADAPFPLVDPPLLEPRPAAPPIGVARLTPKAVARKRSAPAEASFPRPNSPVMASSRHRFRTHCRPQLHIEPEPSARPIIRVAGVVSEWVADVAQAPGRVAFLPGLPDWSFGAAAHPARSAFFRQN